MEDNHKKRTRSHLTSIQVTKEQKQTIDKAYDVYAEKTDQFVSKGEFIESLCLYFLHKFNKIDLD